MGRRKHKNEDKKRRNEDTKELERKTVGKRRQKLIVERNGRKERGFDGHGRSEINMNWINRRYKEK